MRSPLHAARSCGIQLARREVALTEPGTQWREQIAQKAAVWNRRAALTFVVSPRGALQRRHAMRKTHLLTTVAASLLLATAATAADNANQKGKSELANPAPTAQQGAPAEKVAPSMNAGQKRPETTGQAAKPDTASEPKVGDSGRAGMKASEKSEMKAGDKHETTGQSSGASGKAQINESKEKAGVNDKAETKSGASQQSSQSVNGKASTTGQGAAAGAGANLSTEQRTKITTILKQHKV